MIVAVQRVSRVRASERLGVWPLCALSAQHTLCFRVIFKYFKWLLILKIDIEIGTVTACSDVSGKPLIIPGASQVLGGNHGPEILNCSG